MSNNASAVASERPADLYYEYLQVQGTVRNDTDQPMILTGSDLSWGKWMKSPVDVPAHGSITFGSQGRDSSPSGTEGWATWSIGGTTISIDFSCPLNGSNSQDINVTGSTYEGFCNGTGGDVNTCKFLITN